MAVYVAVEIYVPGDSIPTANDKMEFTAKTFESVNGLKNYLDAILGGLKPASVKIVTKDSTTTINTSGSGSVSNTFSFL